MFFVYSVDVSLDRGEEELLYPPEGAARTALGALPV